MEEQIIQKPQEDVNMGYNSYRITFTISIGEIDNQLFKFNNFEGIRDLKDWLCGFHDTRFTRITKNTAILTTKEIIHDIMIWLNGYDLVKSAINMETFEEVEIDYSIPDEDHFYCKYNDFSSKKIILTRNISQINEEYFFSERNMGADDLKQWIDFYESSRYTPLNENSVLITSEYNMEYITDWFKRTGYVKKVVTLN